MLEECADQIEINCNFLKLKVQYQYQYLESFVAKGVLFWEKY